MNGVASRRRRRALPGKRSSLRRTPVSVEQLALVRIVGSAAELDVPNRGTASHAMRFDVMELDERRPVAPSPFLADERAGTTVTGPHRAHHLGRDVPAAGSRAATGPRPLRRRELLPG